MGNPKYLFLWMTIHRPDIRVTWLSERQDICRALSAAGYRAYRRWSLRGIATALRANVFVVSHGVANVNARLSRGALLVNLWHGVGLKSIQFGHVGGNAARADREAASPLARLRLLEYLRLPDILVTTSDLMQAHFADQFRMAPAKCPQLGYPRLDCAGDGVMAATARRLDRREGFEFNAGGFAEVYMYMPTFRDSKRPFLDEALPDLARLSHILRDRNALLYVKPHPRSRAAFPSEYGNILRWPDSIDPSTYLVDLTGMITDYSSILYDYLFTRSGGVILYTFDYEEYVATDRTLMFPFDDNVAGLRVTTFDALCDALQNGSAFDSNLAADFARIRDRFWGGSPSPAAAAIVDYVERGLNPDAGSFE